MIPYKHILIEQITKPNLDIGIAAGKILFPKDTEKINCPELPYRWSVQRKHPVTKQKHGHNILVYYLIYNHQCEVVALTGLYQEDGDPVDTCWLGWYGVLPEFRNRGYGKAVLEYTELLAKQFGKRVIKLWTTEEPDEAAAQFLFEKMNYAVIDRKLETIDHVTYNMLIRSKTL